MYQKQLKSVSLFLYKTFMEVHYEIDRYLREFDIAGSYIAYNPQICVNLSKGYLRW